MGKDLLLGKGTVSFQAINKGTLWGHKEEKERGCPVKIRFPSRPSTDIVSGSTSNQQRVRAAVPNLFFLFFFLPQSGLMTEQLKGPGLEGGAAKYSRRT